MGFVVLLLMIGFAYVAVNVGSQSNMSLRQIAIPLVLVFVAVYLLYPLFAPFVVWLMQVGSHMHLSH